MLTALKTAEDGRGLALRFVECSGSPDMVNLAPPACFRHAELCDLMEDAGEPLRMENGIFSIPMAPWKIVTVRLAK